MLSSRLSNLHKTIAVCTIIAIGGLGFNLTHGSPETPALSLTKNAQGDYPLKVKLGDTFSTTVRNNPKYFNVDESGFGSAFMCPILPFRDIPNTRVTILASDNQTAFDMKNFQDIRFVNEANYPEVQVGHFSGNLPSIKECIGTDSQGETSKACQLKNSKAYFKQYSDILALLKKYDWTPYIKLENPRILGEKSWQLEDNVIPDGYYINSFEKWQKYAKDDHIFVMFYHKNLILELSISDVLARIEIYTNNFDYLMRYDEKTRGEKWRSYLADDIPKWQAKRKQAEADLKNKGYVIDETYVDAPLPK